MNPNHLSLLRCPKTNEKLVLTTSKLTDGRIESGELKSEISNHVYPIVNFIPRFVALENYANSFGFQWNLHDRTQYDATSNFNLSRERFFKETKWNKDLKDELILEAGCGSGRFTLHALNTGATVVSFDYSNAVESNYKSNGQHPNLLIVQANIYEMPFANDFFDKIYCIGVIQHTPNPKKSFLCLPLKLKYGGSLVTDIYVKDLTHWALQPKYWIRPFTAGKPPEKLYRLIKGYIDFIWPLARLIRKIPKYGPAINWKILVADYSRELPGASESTLKEWAYLDTMDMLSPMYDYPQTKATFKRWHQEAKLKEIEVEYGYNGIEGRAVK